jgi:hypothetical protein
MSEARSLLRSAPQLCPIDQVLTLPKSNPKLKILQILQICNLQILHICNLQILHICNLQILHICNLQILHICNLQICNLNILHIVTCTF